MKYQLSVCTNALALLFALALLVNASASFAPAAHSNRSLATLAESNGIGSLDPNDCSRGIDESNEESCLEVLK